MLPQLSARWSNPPKKIGYKRVPHRNDRQTKKGSRKKEDDFEEVDEDKYFKKALVQMKARSTRRARENMNITWR